MNEPNGFIEIGITGDQPSTIDEWKRGGWAGGGGVTVNPHYDKEMARLRNENARLKSELEASKLLVSSTLSEPEFQCQRSIIDVYNLNLHDGVLSIGIVADTGALTDDIFKDMNGLLFSYFNKFKDNDRVLKISVSCMINGETYSYSVTKGKGIAE